MATAAEHGQTLVETALLLPLILVLLTCMLQLLLILHLHLKIQRSAERMAEQVAMGVPATLAQGLVMAAYSNTLRWGTPQPTAKKEKLTEWTAYSDVETATDKNCIAIADISFPLSRSWFAAVGLDTLALRAHAEMPCEAPKKGEPL